MKIIIEWKNGLVEIVSTSGGETGLSTDVNAQGRPGARAMAMMARVRFDLFEQEGLRVDFWWYSTIVDRATASTRMGVGDIGEGLGVPNLNLEPSRVLRLIDRDQLEDVVSITVDSNWRIRRYGDVLINETKFEAQCGYWLGSEASNKPHVRRVKLLDERIRLAHADWDDEKISEACGYPCSAWKDIIADEVLGAGDGAAIDVGAVIDRARRRDPEASMAAIFSSIKAEGVDMSWDVFAETWED